MAANPLPVSDNVSNNAPDNVADNSIMENIAGEAVADSVMNPVRSTPVYGGRLGGADGNISQVSHVEPRPEPQQELKHAPQPPQVPE